MLSLEIVVSGTGSLVTILLWVLVISGDLINSPPMIVWSIIRTVLYIVYVLPDLLANNRFVGCYRRNTATDHLLRHGPALIGEIDRRIRSGTLTCRESEWIGYIAARLENSSEEGRLVADYLATRCIDDADPASGFHSPEDILLAQLQAETPSALRADRVRDLVEAVANFAHAARTVTGNVGTSGTTVARRDERIEPHQSASHPPEPESALEPRSRELGDVHDMATASGRWRTVGRGERIQVCLWALPYLFFQLVLYYRGLIVWLSRRRQAQWHKTLRTHKGGRADRLSGTRRALTGRGNGLAPCTIHRGSYQECLIVTATTTRDPFPVAAASRSLKLA